MSKQLKDNIFRMDNPEIIGLAKNRWLPKSVQMAIAKFHYRRAHAYLAENTGLDKEVRDYLWSDECNRGYSLKSTMIMFGQYIHEPEKYREFYDKYRPSWSRSSWRFSNCFFGSYWGANGADGTPSDLLNRIYEEQFRPIAVSRRATIEQHYYGGGIRYQLERLAKHPNADLALAIQLSNCGLESVQKLAFEKIVELS